MEIIIDNKKFKVIDAKEKITIADSFVVRRNKIGGGNGEAKLYIGNDNSDLRSFFGKPGFKIPCFLLKKDLLKYLDETKAEYLKPEQPYINKDVLPSLWNERKTKIENSPDVLVFDVVEQNQITGSRVYVKSEHDAYELIRELSLPNITYISVIKLQDTNSSVFFYFRLFADFFGDVTHPYEISSEEKKIKDSAGNYEKKLQLIKARVGQGEYRKKLLEVCPFCPITLVSDERLLIASHIKPWADSNNFEKTDPQNGFMFTPTFDRLFDRGYLSFTEEKKTILSPFLSKMTYSKLGISDNRIISHLPLNGGQQQYLDYHRKNILKK